ncbi:hypothetical protein FRC03_010152 [Tulasnella sp. 419]|nr:hypothetical protein FRC03_010152 [Tulasnella sp. 419]
MADLTCWVQAPATKYFSFISLHIYSRPCLLANNSQHYSMKAYPYTYSSFSPNPIHLKGPPTVLVLTFKFWLEGATFSQSSHLPSDAPPPWFGDQGEDKTEGRPFGPIRPRPSYSDSSLRLQRIYEAFSL